MNVIFRNNIVMGPINRGFISFKIKRLVLKSIMEMLYAILFPGTSPRMASRPVEYSPVDAERSLTNTEQNAAHLDPSQRLSKS